MAKIKNENRQFSSAPIALINDDTIPDRARFIYVYMNAKPEDWDYFHEPMAKALKISVDTLKKYIDILIDRGWLEKGDQQNENGKFGPVEYTLKAIRKKTSNKNTDTEKYRNGKIPQQYINSSNDSTINEDNSTILNSPVIDKKEKIILSDDNKKSDDLFDLFWKKYKKGSKKAALKAWNKLKDKQKESALNNVDAYLIYCKRSDRPLKDVSTYLNGECFNDNWSAIPDCYQVSDFDDDRTKRFKKYMVEKFPDLIYHRNPLTFEQCNNLIEENDCRLFEEAMRRLCGRDIHQYYSVKIGVETILKEIQDDDI